MGERRVHSVSVKERSTGIVGSATGFTYRSAETRLRICARRLLFLGIQGPHTYRNHTSLEDISKLVIH